VYAFDSVLQYEIIHQDYDLHRFSQQNGILPQWHGRTFRAKFDWGLLRESLENGGKILRRAETEFHGRIGDAALPVHQELLGRLHFAAQNELMRRNAHLPFELGLKSR
jgi:hypothetical protein